MRIFIKCFDKTTLTIIADPDDTILPLKKKISEKLKIPVEKIILFLAKTFLFTSKTVRQSNIKSNNIISMKKYETALPTERRSFEEAFHFYKIACGK
jgi:hypothetical protein